MRECFTTRRPFGFGVGDDGVVALQTGDTLLDGILGAEAEMGEFGHWHGGGNFSTF